MKGGTGGKVPTARSLASSVKKQKVGRVRVVCKGNSRTLLNRSIKKALKNGYKIRPTVTKKLTKKQAKRLQAINKKLKSMCRYHEIQPAVTASRNNDRVVVMPGLYTEPTARKAKTFDPACNKYKITNDKGQTGAVSYAYTVNCPNDQNLIAVAGRAVGTGEDPVPPREDRRGIPNTGPCVRCNLQIEGSGVSSDDVVVDAGRVASGNGGPRGSVKDVGLRADRADGFVLRGMNFRHAREHGIYILETDGYLLDKFKVYWNGEYGVLTFVEDHGIMENCEAAGSGDSGLYPGAGADTGHQRAKGTEFRYSQQVRYCDSHHNTGGYSGTDGNATHVHHNNFYDNALGFTTDVFTAPGHPGFPQDSDLVEFNNFYDNNFNPYGTTKEDLQPSVPVPVGTGLWIAGGNQNIVRNNHFYDNWRRGAMLFAAPDVTVCGPLIGKPVTDCNPGKFSTSYDNRFYGNVMGVTPAGAAKPNGEDFFWDSFPGNTGNCWYQNTTAQGVALKTSGPVLPNCANGTQPGTSIGLGNVINEVELLGCFAAFTLVDGYDSNSCSWFRTPARPGSARAASVNAAREQKMVEFARSPAGRKAICKVYGSRHSVACDGVDY